MRSTLIYVCVLRVWCVPNQETCLDGHEIFAKPPCSPDQSPYHCYRRGSSWREHAKTEWLQLNKRYMSARIATQVRKNLYDHPDFLYSDQGAFRAMHTNTQRSARWRWVLPSKQGPAQYQSHIERCLVPVWIQWHAPGSSQAPASLLHWAFADTEEIKRHSFFAVMISTLYLYSQTWQRASKTQLLDNFSVARCIFLTQRHDKSRVTTFSRKWHWILRRHECSKTKLLVGRHVRAAVCVWFELNFFCFDPHFWLSELVTSIPFYFFPWRSHSCSLP